MNTRLLLAAVALLALAACGGGAEEAAAPDAAAATAAAAADAATMPEATPAEDASATPAAGEPTATPTPGATPSASATPATAASATARPTPAATAPAARVAMAPPASFATCGVCHSTTAGQNGVGPSLAGIVGRRSGSAAGFSYSAGMRGANVTWNDGTLDRLLSDPASIAPGTAMPAPGLDAAQRRAIIAYLKTL